MISKKAFGWLVVGWFVVGFSVTTMSLFSLPPWGFLSSASMTAITLAVIDEAKKKIPDDIEFYENRYKQGLMTPAEARAHLTRRGW